MSMRVRNFTLEKDALLYMIGKHIIHDLTIKNVQSRDILLKVTH